MGLSAVGVDLGGTKIAAALVNEQGRILKSARLSTDVEGGLPRLWRRSLNW